MEAIARPISDRPVLEVPPRAVLAGPVRTRALVDLPPRAALAGPPPPGARRAARAAHPGPSAAWLRLARAMRLRVPVSVG